MIHYRIAFPPPPPPKKSWHVWAQGSLEGEVVGAEDPGEGSRDRVPQLFGKQHVPRHREVGETSSVCVWGGVGSEGLPVRTLLLGPLYPFFGSGGIWVFGS